MRGKPVTYKQLGQGGVNAADSPYQLGDGEARDARNFVSSKRGKLRKRDGAQTFASLAAASDSLFAMQTPSPFLVTAKAGQISTVTPGGVVVDRSAPAATGWEWVQAPAQGGQGPLYGSNGQDTPLQWDGLAAGFSAWTSTVGTLPNGKFMVYAGNRLFVAGMAAYGALDDPASAVVFSNIANPRDWPAENVVLFDPRDGGKITGLGVIGPYVLVFKGRKAWVIYDTDTGANRPLSKGVGCVSHRSIVETPQGTLFLTEDQGVMLTDGSNIKRLSEKIQPLIDKLQPAYRDKAAAIAHSDRYYLSLATAGSVNDLTLEYDLQTGVWWPHTLAEDDWALWEPSGVPGLYGLKAGSVKVHKPFVPGVRQDDDVSFNAYWKGPVHDFGSPRLQKRVREVYLEGRGVATVNVSRDYATAEELLGVEDFATATGAIDVGEAQILTPGVARTWALDISSNTDDELEIDSYTFMVDGKTN